MALLDVFGAFASVTMLLCYAYEARSHWLTLAFASACALASIYGFLQGAWPVGVTEAVWTLVAVGRWRARPKPRPRAFHPQLR